MKCPDDGAVLEIGERAGVEIDWCPACRGVWLDRGELDRILERSAVVPVPAGPVATRSDDHRHVPAARWTRDWDDDDDFHRDGPRERPRKRRGSLLGELLDL